MKDERLEAWEEFAVEVIFGRRKGVRASLLRGFLFGLSQLYRAGVALRLFLFRGGVKRRYHMGCPVVSVGNLTVGGTGKTPVVELLARRLTEEGRRVAILSRGYRSAAPVGPDGKTLSKSQQKKLPPRVVSDGSELLLDAHASGDEPNMLARNLAGVAVVVDRDRVKGGQYAIRHLGCDMLLLDDGLQYLRLERRVNVVLVDRTSPFGNEYLLPRGTLRESRRQLRRADYIFLTKCDGQSHEALLQRMRKYNRTAPILECRHKPLYLQDITRGEQLPLEALAGKYIATISAIARPESFEGSLRQLGATVEIARRFADHHYYSEDDLKSFMERCVKRGVDFIVTTEKDYVKFPLMRQVPVPVYFLRMEIEILRGESVLTDLVDSLCRERVMPRITRLR